MKRDSVLLKVSWRRNSRALGDSAQGLRITQSPLPRLSGIDPRHLPGKCPGRRQMLGGEAAWVTHTASSFHPGCVDMDGFQESLSEPA